MVRTNGERMARIEADVCYLKKGHDEIRSDIKDIKNNMKIFIDRADERYASKLTEKITYGLVALIITTVIITLLSTIL